MARSTDIAAWAIVSAGILGVASASGLALSREGNLPTGDDVVTVDVVAEQMRFTPDRIEVPRGTKLVVNLTNRDDKVHDLRIGDGYSGRLNPGESSAAYFGEFNVDTRGWCDVAGHKTMGMTLKVDVKP